MKTPRLNIDDAEVWVIKEYGEYCNEAIVYFSKKPLSFSNWYAKAMREKEHDEAITKLHKKEKN